jgi:hypothetical protein
MNDAEREIHIMTSHLTDDGERHTPGIIATTPGNVLVAYHTELHETSVPQRRSHNHSEDDY